ncbi:MAG TPA: helix-turn-helix domain-containing protein [Pseudomonas sp.]|jgi:SOS-response transcriptional repressor LexA|uniref:Helix-turn-helix domain-containing protein n=1 Tax=Pseudomonas helleri TaxID=1608996 RepID=A0A0J6HZ15_9PSED|nr:MULTISPECIES: LexA family transcriptional regulator [Pseudomonas]KMN00908.1 Cro/Cl family transcriptional regulator [Pseudomonas helleri]MQT35221.1 helix-turn-helix domain-containing protein [Pseudomonas helleri]MQT56420.1 helix-turn-helix domain-containing protein [Pseudomonas sp. FSL R10-0399]MQT72763.1 helix-turn-helix domain-containing protein [Pseudomonas helleri]MQT94001.1 helix-turn-helix domain-containing protein [Pseudomonas helleri]
MDKWIALVRTKLREQKLTQEKLAERVGASQGGVGHWLNKRRQPDLLTMNKVLHALGLEHLEVALVIRGRNEAANDPSVDEPTYDITSAFRYPVSDWATAGQINEKVLPGYQPGIRFEVSDHYAKGAAFWLQVMGDAMTAPMGVSVPQGMMILVDPDIEAEPGKMVIARTPELTEATFRQLSEESGQLYLKPLNPTYPKVLFDERCSIIGVVVQASTKF